MAGDSQHHLPAAYLAGFATVRASPPRESLLWVARRAVPRTWRTKVEKVGAAHRLYTIDDPPAGWAKLPPTILDDLFTKSEPRWLEAIEHLLLVSDPGVAIVCGHRFINVLVPFAAFRFARSIDLEERARNRSHEIGLPFPGKALVHYTRAMEALWLAGAVLRSQWTVLHVPPGAHVVVNDLGRFPVETPSGRRAWAIPLRRDAILVLDADEPSTTPAIQVRGEGWVAGPIFHVTMREDLLRRYNDTAARYSRAEMYCDDRAELERVLAHMGGTPLPPHEWEPFALTRASRSPQAAIRSYFHAWLALTVPPSAYAGMAGGLDAFPVFDLPDSVEQLLELYDGVPPWVATFVLSTAKIRQAGIGMVMKIASILERYGRWSK